MNEPVYRFPWRWIAGMALLVTLALTVIAFRGPSGVAVGTARAARKDLIVPILSDGTLEPPAGGEDPVGAAGHRVQPAVGAEGLAVPLLRVGEEEAHLAIEADLVSLALGHIVEEHLTLCVGRRPLGELVAVGHQFPARIRNEDITELR